MNTASWGFSLSSLSSSSSITTSGAVDISSAQPRRKLQGVFGRTTHLHTRGFTRAHRTRWAGAHPTPHAILPLAFWAVYAICLGAARLGRGSGAHSAAFGGRPVGRLRLRRPPCGELRLEGLLLQHVGAARLVHERAAVLLELCRLLAPPQRRLLALDAHLRGALRRLVELCRLALGRLLGRADAEAVDLRQRLGRLGGGEGVLLEHLGAARVELALLALRPLGLDEMRRARRLVEGRGGRGGLGGRLGLPRLAHGHLPRVEGAVGHLLLARLLEPLLVYLLVDGAALGALERKRPRRGGGPVSVGALRPRAHQAGREGGHRPRAEGDELLGGRLGGRRARVGQSPAGRLGAGRLARRDLAEAARLALHELLVVRASLEGGALARAVGVGRGRAERGAREVELLELRRRRPLHARHAQVARRLQHPPVEGLRRELGHRRHLVHLALRRALDGRRPARGRARGRAQVEGRGACEALRVGPRRHRRRRRAGRARAEAARRLAEVAHLLGDGLEAGTGRRAGVAAGRRKREVRRHGQARRRPLGQLARHRREHLVQLRAPLRVELLRGADVLLCRLQLAILRGQRRLVPAADVAQLRGAQRGRCPHRLPPRSWPRRRRLRAHARALGPRLHPARALAREGRRGPRLASRAELHRRARRVELHRRARRIQLHRRARRLHSRAWCLTARRTGRLAKGLRRRARSEQRYARGRRCGRRLRDRGRRRRLRHRHLDALRRSGGLGRGGYRLGGSLRFGHAGRQLCATCGRLRPLGDSRLVRAGRCARRPGLGCSRRRDGGGLGQRLLLLLRRRRRRRWRLIRHWSSTSVLARLVICVERRAQLRQGAGHVEGQDASGDGAPNHACVAGDMTPPALASLARSAYCGALKAYGSASSGIFLVRRSRCTCRRQSCCCFFLGSRGCKNERRGGAKRSWGCKMTQGTTGDNA
eukprot:scaffold71990_cov65-Phaeocystis_antarctica.AAC.3